MAKVDNTTISVSLNMTIQSANKTFSNYQFYGSKQFDDTITIPSYLPSGSISISVTYKMVEFSSGVATAKRIGTAKNGSFQSDAVNGASGNKTYTYTKTTTGGDTWRMYLNDGSTSSYIEITRSDYITVVYTGNFVLSKLISTHKSLPRELKTIGNKITSTLFGYHSDKTTWYTGENEE